MEELYNQLPLIAKPYLIIIIVLLVCIDITIYRFFVEYKKQHPSKKEAQVFKLKEK